MRPLKITMTAFGPYAARQEVDFAKLKGRNFFLIHGPTGAGKTTILDAMCYALYGATSGNQRTGETMRSDYAGPDLPTEVIFDFAIGERLYRVSRRPRQEVLKDRGKGTKVDNGSAALYRLDENRQETALLADRHVTEEIEKLLGFKGDQFRQVVLLPQGDFRKLLLAGSKERQDIMQMLFRTELYRSIEEKLRDKYGLLREQGQQLLSRIQYVLSSAQAVNREELVQHLAGNRQELERAQANTGLAKQQLERAQAALTQGRLDQERLTERQAAEDKLKQEEQLIPIVEQKRRELGKAKLAAGLLDLEAHLRQLEEEVKTQEQKIAEQRGKAADAKNAYDGALRLLHEENQREGQRKAAAAQKIYLESLLDKAAALSAAFRQAEVSEQAAAAAQKSHLETAAQLTVLERRLDEAGVQYELSQTEAAQMGGRKAELEKRLRLRDERYRLEDNRLKAKQNSEQLKKLEAAYEQKQEQYLGARTMLANLQHAWQQGQAAILAAALTEEQPCPVCGSTSHPEKARPSGSLPTQEDMKAQQERCDKVGVEKDSLFQAVHACRAEGNALQQLIAAAEQELNMLAAEPVASFEQAVVAAESDYRRSEQAAKQAIVIKTQLETLTEELKRLTELGKQSQERHHQAVSREQADKAVVKERLAALPPEYRDEKNVTAARQAAEKELHELEKRLVHAQQAAEHASNSVASADATLKNLIEYCAAQKEKGTVTRQQFAERMTQAGFTALEEYLSARKTPATIAELEKRIADFDLRLAAAKERCRRAAANAAAVAIPDVPVLEAQLTACNEQYGAVISRSNQLGELVKQQEKWLTELQQLDAEQNRVHGNYQIMASLFEIASGKDTGVTFERFVLGALLDEVALAANARLKSMSRNRYILQRKTSRDDKRTLSGLDLEVYDNYTGFARQANTLSGGETFLASLSLALGLADVVQAYAGGIHLDTIFVDEGFGTLDPETLDFAIKALLELQQGGRLVGIISHVPELKERIDARLEISLTGRGSRAEFKVG
ncbi:exonuclease SbcC [Anaerospora hongkongensis]|uniref:Nuclease SbcCD subunit C n=1 Tax=Anaerospora hongkongensis TaxID=244830 RepID=A0A4R1PZX4_9FIRM|nr:SMC family ATPase [Anaerospora hongkongensis]TCL38613.1 exonuclease SbcC [Anaerospora hongkongensis]